MPAIPDYLYLRDEATAVTGGGSTPKIAKITNRHLSSLTPYGSIIITCGVIFIVLLSNILERWVLRMVYKDTYRNLEKPGNERRRRSFTYYHVGAMMLFSLFCTGVYPVLMFLVGPGDFGTHVGRKGGGATIGDLLFLFAEIYTAYYLYEMCFRTQFASPLTIAHHVGLLLVVQTSVALFADSDSHKEATLEFYMCMVWGAFDVVVEMPVFVSMIIWRVKRQNHKLLAHIGLGCCIWILVAATTEVVVTIYLLNRSWHRWGTVFRVITPVVFALWIATQLYGAYRLYTMGRAQLQEHRKASGAIESESIESGSSESESTKSKVLE
ncbi:unnamed protein product [Clonostachys solani]|uniref:TLC domain-containing protein n=1 Tax=Clonostachys solani TaxID=160281 RepID=A0A9P0EJI5_9HYPO|nr:unnamed protein product [Clonostachys solani]